MQRTTTIHAERWHLRAEAAWGSEPRGQDTGQGTEQDTAALRAENDQLRRKMAGRAVVDRACGMVMVLTPCRRGAARGLLVEVARQCDLKLREVAAALVATTEDEPLPEQMHRALRRALVRLYTADRRFHTADRR
ncbi:ANTAR domain-containing protein [Streptomyces iconiensis]|uniref:ANTAR domain-containing protein n=1 Tax=Streptomyces iconiensis TaxID=1384038 RepID=A0ABT6ZUB8_9ACTN|nr:ANTAR domain-containing protein [Streptomyces iconiensis]MDJ1132043.1 ANTAR domain-containing protein [Streptomyces iconiensis]